MKNYAMCLLICFDVWRCFLWLIFCNDTSNVTSGGDFIENSRGFNLSIISANDNIYSRNGN